MIFMNKDLLEDFPLLKNKTVAYLDNGATTQKPDSVIKAVCGYYGGCNANPHRGAYALSVKATDIYETARGKTQKFINAASADEIIFTKNATEALNLIAYSYALPRLKTGDEIVITVAEHHSNLVPWQFVAKNTGATLKYIYLEPDGHLSREDIEKKITNRTKIVAVTHISNVLGIVNPIAEIAARAHEKGAVVVADGSQSVAHIAVDVRALNVDFFVFSGHKMLSPMGIGVLYGRRDILEDMPPFLMGGDMIEYVEEQDTTFAELPQKFEAGTQNVGGAAGLSAAIDYLTATGFDKIGHIERELLDYALPQLRELPFVTLYGCDTKVGKTGIITFNVQDVHPHDVATVLDSFGVAVRAGHHCAQPLMKYLRVPATCRASFYLYNTKDDIDRLIAAIKKVRGVMGFGTE